jgi:hypothetical protein
LPELRLRLTRLVTLKDALSHVLVSKVWTSDFVAIVWFTIGLIIHPCIAHLIPGIVAEYGHRIRSVENAKSFAQFSVLTNGAVHDLGGLHIDPTGSAPESEPSLQEAIL